MSTLQDYRVVIIIGEINGISTAVNLDRLGIPYTVIDPQVDIGGTWIKNMYLEARVNTLGFWLLIMQLPTKTTEQLRANAIISAVGLFSTVNLPDFNRIKDCKGHVLYTTLWDHLVNCGFKPTDYLLPVEYVGKNRVTLDQTWKKDSARSYLGHTVPGYPSLYTLYGPKHQPRGGRSLHSWSGIWGCYALSLITWMVKEGARSVNVKQSVYELYNREIDEAQRPLIWPDKGKGYKHGRQGVNMPWTIDEYHARVVRLNLEG
ncbi:hypothetical protein BDV12DRAFT_204623 [Aspergillus spectabilis]